jgi:hypothetical protein
MPESPKIQILRLAFIWIETLTESLQSEPPAAGLPLPPLHFLGDRLEYQLEFSQVLLGHPLRHPGLIQPWRKWGAQNFWKCYLEGKQPTGKSAWSGLVPFRAQAPATLSAQGLSGRIETDSFFYPHGVSLVVGARLTMEAGLEDAVDQAFAIRRDTEFDVYWDGGGAEEKMTLNAFADKALTALRGLVLGPAAAQGPRPVTPFTVVTVLRGSDVEPTEATPEGGEVHRALEALVSWRPTWRDDALPELANASLPIRTAPLGHVLYGGKRGRAIWFPGSFTKIGRRLHTLGCYHTNQVFTALQIESLSGLLRETALQLGQGGDLSPAWRYCAQRAAGILGRLYSGHRSTYRTSSAKAHIKQNDLVEIVNQMRDHFGMGPLA